MILLPGFGGSGPDHWQTLWERWDPRLRRFSPSSWDAPVLADWIDALEASVAAEPEPPVLVAHSLACLLVLHWSARSRRAVRGAFLVALPDPNGALFPAEAESFRAPPMRPLPFPSLIVASTDDPYGAPSYVAESAEALGADLHVAGALGHINGASGLGDWPRGRVLLDAFVARTDPV